MPNQRKKKYRSGILVFAILFVLYAIIQPIFNSFNQGTILYLTIAAALFLIYPFVHTIKDKNIQSLIDMVIILLLIAFIAYKLILQLMNP